MELPSVMSTPVTGLVAALVVIGLTYLVHRWRNPKCNGVLPPGSMGFPLIGETLQLIASGYTLDLPPFIKKRVHKYGPIFRTSLVGRSIVVTADPEINSFIYNQEGRTVELWYLDSISKVFKQDGEVKTTAGGAIHKYLRSITLNHFGSESLKSKLLADIQRYVDKVFTQWSNHPSVEMQRGTLTMLYDFNAYIMFGYDPEKSNENISESLITLADGFMSFPVNVPGTKYNKCLKAQKRLVNTFKALVKERRQASVAAARGDFLDQALRDIENEQFLTEEFVSNLLFGVLFASGSISGSLTLMFKLLAENPSVVKELTAEHETFLKQRKDPKSPITWEEYKSMTFTLYVIYEVFRLSNAMPFLLRRTTKDVNIKGYTIPAGWTIMVANSALHLNPQTHKDPLDFNPWRWKDHDQYSISKTLQPFGGGTRQCAGADYTRVFMAIFLHTLVTKYSNFLFIYNLKLWGLLTSNRSSGSGCCSMSDGEKNENDEYMKKNTDFRRKKKPTTERKRRGRSPSKSEAVVDIEDIMFSIDNVQTIRASLLDWYDRSRRDLPWRSLDKGEPETRAYGVWVSEIMLQQTRVQTVVQFYNRWMLKWPTVQHLSRASLEEVNEMWAGLGYYRRARFLFEGAKMIVKEGGRFPRTVSSLRKIPGIGEYTAGAIASIAFGEVVPVVDGNVIRVIARLKAISGNPKDPKLIKQVWKAAAQLVDLSRPGDFNQALMELGATLCTPTNPSCSTCPVFDHCEALSISKHDSSVLVTDYPAKGIKIKQRHDYSAVCVVEILESQGTPELGQSSRFLLVKRPDEGLLAGLWEFPSVSLDGEADLSTRRESINSLLSKNFGLEAKKNFEIVNREDVGDFIHIFTHIRLKIYVEHLVLCLKGEGSKLFRKQEKKSILWKCVENKVMSTMGLTSSVRKAYAMVEKFQAGKTSSSSNCALPRKKQKS